MLWLRWLWGKVRWGGCVPPWGKFVYCPLCNTCHGGTVHLRPFQCPASISLLKIFVSVKLGSETGASGRNMLLHGISKRYRTTPRMSRDCVCRSPLLMHCPSCYTGKFYFYPADAVPSRHHEVGTVSWRTTVSVGA